MKKRCGESIKKVNLTGAGMEISSIMFALLRSGIQGTALGEEVKNFITPEGLPALFALSKKHDLAHLVGDVLDKNGLLPDGSEQRKRFLRERNMAVYRYEQQQYDFEQICATLEDAQIPFLPLKGSILRTYYPEPWMRTSCDIDILVQTDVLDRAAQILCDKLGYTRAEQPGSNELSLHTQSGVHLELHFDLTDGDIYEYGYEVLSKMLDYAQPTEGHEYHLQINDDVFYFYHIAHMAKHIELGGCGVRSFLDLWILRNRADGARRIGEKLLRDSNIDTFAEVCERLSERWFGDVPDTEDERGRKMETYVLTGGVYGTLENHRNVQQAKKGGKVRYFLSKVFVSNKELKVRYPILRKRPWLIPFYHLKRFFRLLTNGTTAKKSVKEFARLSAVTQDEQQGWAQFLQDVGLK